jgi:anaerobic selenocysteine-containing dehydrogenase
MISLQHLKFPAPTLREWEGPLTADLVRAPGKFGLGQVPVKTAPTSVTTSICGFCSTGCNLKIHQKDGQPTNLTADVSYPVNLGMACPKGWEALTPLAAPDRATQPLIRRQRGGKAEPTTWAEAARFFTERMKKIQSEHGADSVAFLSTGQICLEEMAYLGAFAKMGMGMIHGDGNTRQCMATSVVAYKQAFGFDAPPFTYADFEESEVLVFLGANPCIAHPIMWQRVLRNPHSPEIIVIDPRRTETAMAATWHLPVAAKGDLALLYAVAKILIEHDWLDHDFLTAHTNDFDGFRTFLETLDLNALSAEAGISLIDIERLASLVKKGRRVSFWWTMGINQSHQAVRTAQAIINLALMGGHFGRPGTGANSITGQCNAMGSRLFANTTNLLGGHDFTNPDHREKIAAITGFAVETIPTQNSWAYDQILEGVESGKIKGLWIIATNPAHSWMHQDRFRSLVDKLEFFVVQDMYHSTETAQLADLLLPAAGWGEKEGCFINSERRIGVVRRVSSSPGQALSDFNIIRLLAQSWGVGEMFREWTTPEAVFRILQRCTVGQPCDITGIEGYDMIQAEGGIQWPYPASAQTTPPERERRLFTDGRFFHPDGRAKFLFESSRPLPEPADKEYPFTLLTGRGSSAQWHTETRTGKSLVLKKLHPRGLWLEIHPDDAQRLGLAHGDTVSITSRRATVQAQAKISATVPRSYLFLPMHDPTMNRLTHWAVDPYSRQPNYKACAVTIGRG